MMTPFILKYRLEMEHWPYRKEEVQQLERGRSGVYALWMPYGECLYVGKSETCLRRRLLQHLQRETNPILSREFYLFGNSIEFSYAFTGSREETDALETAIIRDWQPRTNRAKLK